jgi:hypothetical protein
MYSGDKTNGKSGGPSDSNVPGLSAKAFSEQVTHYGCGYHLRIWGCSTFVEYMTQYK